MFHILNLLRIRRYTRGGRIEGQKRQVLLVLKFRKILIKNQKETYSKIQLTEIKFSNKIYKLTKLERYILESYEN